jgi:hypothetical protein
MLSTQTQTKSARTNYTQVSERQGNHVHGKLLLLLLLLLLFCHANPSYSTPACSRHTYLILDTQESVEYDGSVTTLHVEQRVCGSIYCQATAYQQPG